jgi:hypothetical protein
VTLADRLHRLGMSAAADLLTASALDLVTEAPALLGKLVSAIEAARAEGERLSAELRRLRRDGDVVGPPERGTMGARCRLWPADCPPQRYGWHVAPCYEPAASGFYVPSRRCGGSR